MGNNKYKGNLTEIDPDEPITPVYDNSFPATEYKKTKRGKIIPANQERNAAHLRDFDIENKK